MIRYPSALVNIFEFVLLQARYLADRVMREAGSNDPAAQIKTLYRIALSREPSQAELGGQLEFIRKQREFRAAGTAVTGSGANTGQSVGLSALIDLSHVMLNAKQFVYTN